ncbi:anti-sigma factor domain-containing protein [Streptomyces sp. NPDC048018]|uniref:anti-sigma factor n=1 Tax=Streptomyces sp. NPDC048018 TaxID=3365499 RepID=UPI00371B1255
MTPDDVHTLTGAYALNALGDDERAEFEEHLADCAACAREVRELRATAARLGLAEAAPVPPAMEAAVMRRIASVPQLPPDPVEDPASPSSAGPEASPRQRGPARPEESAHPASSARPVDSAQQSARPAGEREGAAARSGVIGRGPRRVLVWALAASVAGVAALAGTAIVQYRAAEEARQDAARVEQAANEVAAVLAAPDARLAAARLPDGASGTVVVSDSRDQAVFTATGMARPPRGKVYQLWFDDGGTMRSAGLMDPDSTTTVTLLDGPVDRATGVGVTLEPAGGSPEPTTAPLAVVAFPAA